jgi:hypothetical protein
MNKTALASLLEGDTCVKSCPGIPMAAAPLEMIPEQVGDVFKEVVTVTEGMPTHFVFHVEDEMGHQEWADQKTQIALVPAFHLDVHVNV